MSMMFCIVEIVQKFMGVQMEGEVNRCIVVIDLDRVQIVITV
jgi:hypothetical protein